MALAQRVARAGGVIWAPADSKVESFVDSWIEGAMQAGMKNYVVAATDDTLFEKLREQGKNVYRAEVALDMAGKAGGRWGLLLPLLRAGLDVLASDIDVAWLRDPFPYFRRYPGADILVSSDHPRDTASAHTKGQLGGEEFETLDLLALYARARERGGAGDPAPADLELEDPLSCQSSFNVGIMYFRHGPAVEHCVEAFMSALRKQPTNWDQGPLNDVLREGMFEGIGRLASATGQDRYYFEACNSTLKLGVLPVAQFSSGTTFFTKRLFRQLHVLPFAAHPTYTEGRAAKLHRLRDARIFYDPPAYYSEGNFLVYDVALPPALMKVAAAVAKGATPAHHIALVQFQLGLLGTAIRAAAALDRVLVLPPFLCTCEHWGLDAEFLNCVQTAGDMQLPFLCEADNVLNLNTFMAPESPVRVRESTFLQNPRLDPAVKASVATVALDWEGAGAAGRDGMAAATARIQGRTTEAGLKSALQNLEGYRVLHFSSMHGLLAPLKEGTAIDLRRVAPGDYCCQRPDATGQGQVPYSEIDESLGGVWEAWEAWPAEPGTAGRENLLGEELIRARFDRIQDAQYARAPSEDPRVTFPVPAAGFCATRGYAAFLRAPARVPFDRRRACPPPSPSP